MYLKTSREAGSASALIRSELDVGEFDVSEFDVSEFDVSAFDVSAFDVSEFDVSEFNVLRASPALARSSSGKPTQPVTGSASAKKGSTCRGIESIEHLTSRRGQANRAPSSESAWP